MLALWPCVPRAAEPENEAQPQPATDACEFHEPLAKVANLRELLAKEGGIGIEIGEPGENMVGEPASDTLWFNANGTFSFTYASGRGCLKDGQLSFDGATARGRCQTLGMGEGAEGEWVEGSLTVTAFGGEVMEASFTGHELAGTGRAFRKCREGGRCTWSAPDAARLVQLIPGADDRTLFDAVSAMLLRKVDGECPRVFTAPQARTPRVESEVFFSSPGARQAASALAKELEGILGPVEPKPWPGEWPYDVIVVAGSQKATPKPKTDDASPVAAAADPKPKADDAPRAAAVAGPASPSAPAPEVASASSGKTLQMALAISGALVALGVVIALAVRRGKK